MLITNVHTLVIDRLTITDEGKKLFEYDRYEGGVNRYENRLIVQSYNKIEEFYILADGTLERISFFENRSGNEFGIIDADRFYSMGRVMGYAFIDVFDLKQTPMQFITSVKADTRVNPLFFINENHIMIADIFQQRIELINRQTFNKDGYIYGFYLNRPMAKSGSLLFVPHGGHDGTTASIKIINMEYINNVYEMTKITNIDLDVTGPVRALIVDDNTMTVETADKCIIYDIGDLMNPIVLYNISINNIESVILTVDRIYIYFSFGKLEVYDRDGQGGYTLIFEDYGWTVYRNNIYLYDRFLFMINGYELKVYDVFNDFQEVFSHGNHAPLPDIIYCQNGLYFIQYDFKHYVESDYQSWKANLYSVLDNRLIATFEVDYIKDIVGFFIIDDFVYISYNIWEPHYVGIYYLNEGGLEYIKSVLIGNTPIRGSFVKSNLIFFRSGFYDRVDVYMLNGLNVDFVYRFQGYIQTDALGQSQNFILNNHNNNIHFRDINNPSNIIMSGILRQAGWQTTIINENTFVICGGEWEDWWMDVYEFCLTERNINFIERHNGDFKFGNYGIIVEYDVFTGESLYYTIINGRLHRIGEKQGTRNVIETRFFFDIGKMVQIARSGIWMYDFEYEEYISEGDIVVELPSMDVRVFPNPVRGGDVSFKIQVPGIKYQVSDFEVSIYNIRGQLVRKVSDFAMKDGEGTFVWDRRNDRGIDVASGVYFYQVTGGGYQMTGRFLVIR